MTNNLRVIRNAWRFCYVLSSVFKVQCCSFDVSLLTP
ncbi:DUF3265 domain-containing protein [Vibrio vulnificus]